MMFVRRGKTAMDRTIVKYNSFIEMKAEIHWVAGPWPGKLALAARPRGGDWLADEITRWQRADIQTVFSLLTPEEETELDLAHEAQAAQAHGMTYLSFPIPDRGVPGNEFTVALAQLDAELMAGRD